MICETCGTKMYLMNGKWFCPVCDTDITPDSVSMDFIFPHLNTNNK